MWDSATEPPRHHQCFKWSASACICESLIEVGCQICALMRLPQLQWENALEQQEPMPLAAAGAIPAADAVWTGWPRWAGSLVFGGEWAGLADRGV